MVSLVILTIVALFRMNAEVMVIAMMSRFVERIDQERRSVSWLVSMLNAEEEQLVQLLAIELYVHVQKCT